MKRIEQFVKNIEASLLKGIDRRIKNYKLEKSMEKTAIQVSGILRFSSGTFQVPETKGEILYPLAEKIIPEKAFKWAECYR